jgi:hypothetical protein
MIELKYRWADFGGICGAGIMLVEPALKPHFSVSYNR